VNLKIIASMAMPIVTAAVLGGVLAGTHHTSLPSLAPRPSITPLPQNAPVMEAATCERELGKQFSGVALTRVSPVQVDDFTHLTKSPVSIVEFYSSFPAKFNKRGASEAVSLHDIPLIQLNPGTLNRYALRKLASGTDNSKIVAYAEAVKAFKFCVVISFGHEMNGWWYRWGMPWNTPATFIKAWRNMHRIFAAAGATNVIWSWDPSHQYTEVTAGKIASPASKWYPGNDYVDWIGLDGYLSKDNNGRPQSFNEIFGHQVSYIRQVAPHKLLYLAETGVADTAAEVTQIDGLFKGIKQDNMAGLIWFEQNRKQKWSLTGRIQAIKAYKRGVSGFPKPRTIDVLQQ